MNPRENHASSVKAVTVPGFSTPKVQNRGLPVDPNPVNVGREGNNSLMHIEGEAREEEEGMPQQCSDMYSREEIDVTASSKAFYCDYSDLDDSDACKAFCNDCYYDLEPEINSVKKRLESFCKATPGEDEFLDNCSCMDGNICCRRCDASKHMHHVDCDMKERKVFPEGTGYGLLEFSQGLPGGVRGPDQPMSQTTEFFVRAADEELAVPQPENHLFSTKEILAIGGCIYTDDGYIKCCWCLKATALSLDDCHCQSSRVRMGILGHCSDNPATND